MNTGTGQDKGAGDPRYRQGLAHLQAGAWDEAIACFEGLAEEYPDSLAVQQGLEDARLRAGLDASAGVRAKRTLFPWRQVLVGILVVIVVGVLAVIGIGLIQRQVLPVLARVQEEQRLTQLEESGRAYLASGELDNAEYVFKELLESAPEHEEAQQGLEQIASDREVKDLYAKAVVLQETGSFDEALNLYIEILVRKPRYQDVILRVDEISQQQGHDSLFEKAEADFEAGRAEQAVSKYELLRELNVNFKQDMVVQRLFDLYLQLGRELIEQDPPASESVTRALDYFVAALALNPRSTEAALEKQLANLYLEGQSWYQKKEWESAVTALRAVHDQRPDYLRGTVTDMLYESYVGSGDDYWEAGDVYLAYERYRAAESLPVADTALATGRMYEVALLMTPTPTATVTRTPRPTPTWTAMPSMTPLPPPESPTATATPVPLAAFNNKIVFQSDDEDQPGLWVMDPDGENRQYLANHKFYMKEYERLLEQESLSPDGRYRAFVQKVAPAAQIFVELPPHEKYGPQPPRQLTRMTGLSYDPVWSPDGGRIAFVGQENGSDDIWVVYANGSGLKALVVDNGWEWDKHPSWSPDSTKIVFWSNRGGSNQIYVMDDGGLNVRNISNTEWAEYDPIWIK